MMNDSLRVGDDGSDGADGSQQKLYFSSCEFGKQRLFSCKAEIMIKNICKSWRKSSEKMDLAYEQDLIEKSKCKNTAR